MRVAALALLALLFLAGCSDGKVKQDVTPSDFEVTSTETKGVLLGIVVDDSIRPVAGAQVAVTGAAVDLRQETDEAGKFQFGDLEPGTYFIAVQMLNYGSAQTTADVLAGDKDPPIARVQILRLFSQEPFLEAFVFDGFLQCSISGLVGTTCVNDYTRLVGCLNPSACVCPGGCFREQELAKQGGNIREYVYTVTEGWQTILYETTWKRTSDYSSESLTLSVSYHTRPTASHFYANRVSVNPLYLRLDLGVEGPGQNLDPTLIPPEGTNELFAFFNSGGSPPGGGVAINQAFKHFQHTAYHGVIPEGWSFVAGDLPPF